MRPVAIGAIIAIGCVAIALGSLTRSEPSHQIPTVPTPPPPTQPTGSLLRFRVAAQAVRDAEAVERALTADGLDNPPAGYRWEPYRGPGPDAPVGLVVRETPMLGGSVARYRTNLKVLVKLDDQNITERDLIAVNLLIEYQRNVPAVLLRLTPEGGRRLGELTRSHLPEGGVVWVSKLAVIVGGWVVAAPDIRAELKDRCLIELGGERRLGEADRVVETLAETAAINDGRPKTRAVSSPDGEAREAIEVDMPAIARADRVLIESFNREVRVDLKGREDVEELKRALRPNAHAMSLGKPEAIVSFYRGDDLIRTAWVDADGRWMIMRPGASWATGSEADLARVIKRRLGRGSRPLRRDQAVVGARPVGQPRALMRGQ